MHRKTNNAQNIQHKLGVAFSYLERNKNKWVVNLSSRPLSDTEVSLLEKGLNFPITPPSIPATETVAKVDFTQNEPTQSGELLIFCSKRHSHLSLT